MLAGSLPGWEAYELGPALYQPRYLTDEGRLFFDSPEALVPQDDNRSEEVYEFEPAGVGGCANGSAAFSPVTGGCVALISSGEGPGESAFADASENGDDVFFFTAGRLGAADRDTAVDLYDAHVCSAAVPCSQPSAEGEPCRTAESCRSAPSPQPSIFGPPASATFAGPGNAKPAPLTPLKPTSKSKPTAAQLLSRALQACRRRFGRQKSRRTGCERQARKRYGGHGAKKKRVRAHSGERAHGNGGKR